MANGQDEREVGMGESEFRIAGNGLPQQVGRLTEALFTPALQTQNRMALAVKRPGAQINGTSLSQRRELGTVQLRLYAADDLAHHIILKLTQPVCRQLAAVRPQNPSAGGFQQLYGHPQAFACFPYRSLNHVVGAKFAADLADAVFSPAIVSRRVARDHHEAGYSGQPDADILAKHLSCPCNYLASMATGKGQYRQGRTVMMRRGLARARGGCPFVLFNHCDKAVPATTDRGNAVLCFPAVPDRLAGRLDTAAQGRLGDHLACPQRIQQFLAAHDAVPVLCQVGQQVEHQRFDRTRVTIVAQLEQFSIEFVVPESQQHRSILR